MLEKKFIFIEIYMVFKKKKEIDCNSSIVLYSKKACTCTNTCTLYLKSVRTLSVLLKTCFYSIILIYYD